MTIPPYHDREAISKSLRETNEHIELHKEEIKRAMAIKNAIRAMCDHELLSDGDPRWSTSSCRHCGYSPNASSSQITIYL
jgi:hypothetical protein